MKLPESKTVDPRPLAAAFSNVTNSYKFYWLLSILEFLRIEATRVIPIETIAIRMIANVWYPINVFRLSFGKQDQFVHLIKSLQGTFQFQTGLKKSELEAEIDRIRDSKEVTILLRRLSRYVPYRFLAPWYTNELIGVPESQREKQIESLAMERNGNRTRSTPYNFSHDGKKIILSEEWKTYFLQHLSIIEGFTLWHLNEYLQKRNPHVPNVSQKLFPPLVRSLNQARLFWATYIDRRGSIRCIYSNRQIKEDFTIDHFLPWSFVAHDLLWNLLPVPRDINSSKGDKLPAETYVVKFAKLQYDAFKCCVESGGKASKLIEDYSIFFRETIGNISSMQESTFVTIVQQNIKPLLQTATNMGFLDNWSYRG